MGHMRQLILGLCILLAHGGAFAGAKATYGWIEMVQIEPMGTEVKAKFDTGALTSAMHATNVERFEKDGEKWVRFDVEVVDEKTDKLVTQHFQKPLHRRLVVKGAGGRDHRLVVLMDICIKDTIYEEQFSLDDRDDMNYPVLLGRRTIQRLGLVDVTRTFTKNPKCGENAKIKRFADVKLDDDIGI